MILLTRIIALIVAIAVGAQSIQLSWTPHPENRWLRLVYYCGTDFVAVNIFESASSERWVGAGPRRSAFDAFMLDVIAGCASHG